MFRPLFSSLFGFHFNLHSTYVGKLAAAGILCLLYHDYIMFITCAVQYVGVVIQSLCLGAAYGMLVV